MVSNTASASNPDGASIVLVDPSVLGQSHLLANLGFIELCCRLFPNVHVVARDSHCRALLEYGTPATAGVVFHPYVTKFQMIAIINKWRSTSTPLVFLNLEYWLFILVTLVRARRGVKTCWILHSHFAHVGNSIWSRLKLTLRKIVLFHLTDSAEFIVYGDRVRTNVISLLGHPTVGARIHAVIHPLGIRASPEMTHASSEGDFIISYVPGWHPLDSHLLTFLASLREAAIATKSIRFEMVSNSTGRTSNGLRFLTRDYRQRLAGLAGSGAILYAPLNDYARQSSGALMDSFVSGIPLVGLSTEFQKEVEDLVGPIGYFFKDYDEVLNFVLSFDGVDVHRNFETFRTNLLTGRQVIMDKAYRQLSDIFLSRRDAK